MPIVPLALLGALVFSFINVLKFAQARQWGAVLTQVCTWLAGIGAVFLVSASTVGETIRFTAGEGVDKHIYTLTTLDIGSKLVLGILASSLFATAFNQFLKSHDNADTSATPPLFASLNQTVTPEVPGSEPSGRAGGPTKKAVARKRA